MNKLLKRLGNLALVLALLLGCVTTVAFAEDTTTKHCLSAGFNHSVALLNDGTMVAWGANGYNQLADQNKSKNLVELIGYKRAIAGSNRTVFVKNDGTVWTCGVGDSAILRQISGISDVVDVYAGSMYYYALKADGTLWSWTPDSNQGINGEIGRTGDFRKPGQVSVITNIKECSTQNYTCYAVLEDGTVWAWGANDYGMIPGGNSKVYTPIQIQGLGNATSVSVGGNFGMALKSDGTVWTWGSNSYGQLGNGSTTNCYVPTQINGLADVVSISAGYNHALALKSDGTVWAWGLNNQGQMGDYTITNRTTPVKVKELKNVTDISAGSNFCLARKSDGSIWGWGSGSTNLLAAETFLTRPIPIFGGIVDNGGGEPAIDIPTIKQLYTGENHTLALCVDDTLWAWGKNTEGQLGVGSTGNKNTPVKIIGIGKVIAVVPGLNHTFIICEDGSIWTWGKNDQGQLGIGNTENQFIPVRLQ